MTITRPIKTTLAALTLSLLLMQPAFGASTGTPSTAGTCKLNEALDTLLEVKDSDMPKDAKDRAEITARKEVLGQIVTCSYIEIDSFRARLSALDLEKNNAKDRTLRDVYLSDLDTAVSYYQQVEEKLAAGNLDLDKVRKLAEEILAWRDSFYSPTLANANDFCFVVESEKALATAQTRFEKISSTLNLVKIASSKDIKKLLTDADASLKKGGELLAEAHSNIWDISSVFNTSSTKEATDTASAATSTPDKEESSSTVASIQATASSSDANATSSPAEASENQTLSLVKESLGELRKAYTNYVEISKLVKKILGL